MIVRDFDYGDRSHLVLIYSSLFILWDRVVVWFEDKPLRVD